MRDVKLAWGMQHKLGMMKDVKKMRLRDYDLDAFVDSYIETALWSSTDESDDSGGDPLDANYTADDLTCKAKTAMRHDCREFVRFQLADLQASGLSPARAGHDFWLTRNGHGAGFWDEGIGEIGNRLTAASKPYGSCDLYVSRKRIHVQ